MGGKRTALRHHGPGGTFEQKGTFLGLDHRVGHLISMTVPDTQ
jgi:hypothetical protein